MWTRKRIQTNHPAGGLLNDGPPVWDGYQRRFRIVGGKSYTLHDYHKDTEHVFPTLEAAMSSAQITFLQA